MSLQVLYACVFIYYRHVHACNRIITAENAKRVAVSMMMDAARLADVATGS